MPNNGDMLIVEMILQKSMPTDAERCGRIGTSQLGEGLGYRLRTVPHPSVSTCSNADWCASMRLHAHLHAAMWTGAHLHAAIVCIYSGACNAHLHAAMQTGVHPCLLS